MNRVIVFLISLYRRVSVWFPSRCIYYPSCSCYSRESFRKYSFFKALALSIRRILRCNPYNHGGYDPLP